MAKNMVLTLLLRVKMDSGHYASSMETCCVFCLMISFHLSTWQAWVLIVLALGRILSLCVTPERLCGLENVTSIDTGVSSQWEEFQFYPFNVSVCRK